MWKKILGGIVIVIGVMMGIVMYATSGMSDTANEFFIHVKTKHYDDAYNMLSEDFQQSTSKEDLKNFLIQNALSNFESVSWNSRSVENNMGKLEGTITTNSGGTIPLTMNFIKNQDEWKIYSLSKPTGGIQTNADDKKEKIAEKPISMVLDENHLKLLIQESILVFADSVNQKSMSKLYDHMSLFWRERTNIGELDKAFTPFYQAEIDLTILKSFTPVFDKKPKMTEQGEIILEGHYETTPSVVYFKNIYIKENGKWKLSGINVNIK